MSLISRAPNRRVAFTATVIRADGTRQELGIVAYRDNRWWKNLQYRLCKALGIPFEKDF
jgi:hypothetical protein